MLLRLLARSLGARAAHTALALLAVAVGAGLATSLLGVAFELRERMAKELRGFGANILLVPRARPLETPTGIARPFAPPAVALLREQDLPRLKTVFWRHNIIALAPFLSRAVEVKGGRALLVGTWFAKEVQVPRNGRTFAFSRGVRQVPTAEARWRTGVRTLAPSWQVDGEWVEDSVGGAVVGQALARRLHVARGDTLTVRSAGRARVFAVKGVLRTGGAEEDEIFADLASVQALVGLPGSIDKAQVSALVTPDNHLAVRARSLGPTRLRPEEYETWYCTPYLDSITFQIEETLPDVRATAVRQIADAEQAFISKTTLAFWLVSGVGLLAAGLGLMATMARAVWERRAEIGLMKALGGTRRQITVLFMAEASVIGLAGGALGYVVGTALAITLGLWVFDGPIVPNPLLFPVVLGAGVALVLFGVLVPVRDVLRVDPISSLRGGDGA